MLFKLNSYLQLVTESLIQYFDQDCSSLPVVEVNNNFRQCFSFYMLSNLKAKYCLGRFNIIIGSCNPVDNWRNSSHVFYQKYTVLENCFEIKDYISFHEYMDEMFDSLKRQNSNYIYISHNELDQFDIEVLLQKLIKAKFEINNWNNYLLKDGNSIFYHSGVIPPYLEDNIKNQLTVNNLYNERN